MRRFIPHLLAGLLAVTALDGCTVVRQRLGTQLVPLETELKLGEQVAAQIESQEKVLGDHRVQAYVRSIVERLVVHAQADRPEITYQVKVLDNHGQVNAFALPGGYIYVYSGLLLAADDEAEVAGVLGHEIGHVVGRHSANQMASQMGLGLLAAIALGEEPQQLAQLVAQLSSAGALASFSRDDERESDEYGVEYTVAAGYDPQGLKSFFAKLKALEEGHSRSDLEKFLSTHPATSERIRRIDKLIAKAGSPPGERFRPRFLRETASLRR